MSAALRAAPLVLAAAVVQVSVLSWERVLGAELDLLLVVVVAGALLRGSIVGAGLGFAGGLLVDVMTLDTLGVSALALTLVGFWAGRYGETTGQGRRHAAALTAAAASLASALGSGGLHFLLGETVAASEVARGLVPSAVLAAALVGPVLRLTRVVLGATEVSVRIRESAVV